ncbi:hypothetical protein H0H93_009974, partial [Arthromyces matolae]
KAADAWEEITNRNEVGPRLRYVQSHEDKIVGVQSIGDGGIAGQKDSESKNGDSKLRRQIEGEHYETEVNDNQGKCLDDNVTPGELVTCKPIQGRRKRTHLREE